ncbi:MAG: DUF2341 domain-containing protein [Promethearchaeia archaeon]
MIKPQSKKFQVMTLLVMMILMLSAIFLMFPADKSTDNYQNQNTRSQIEDIKETEDLNSPLHSSDVEWWNDTWQHRVPINITSTGEQLENYPTRIDIQMANWIDNEYMNETGKDIRFVDSTNTELDYWIEKIDDTSGNNSTIWVKVPTLELNEETTFYMYFGNPNATCQSSAEDTFIAVLDGTQGAWHFDEGEGISANDTSGNENHGTLMEDPTWVDGVFGNALELSNPGYVEIGNNESLNSDMEQMSLSFWLKPQYDEKNFEMPILEARNGEDGRGYAFRLERHPQQPDRQGIFFWVGDGGNTYEIQAQEGVEYEYKLNEWQHVVATFDQGLMSIYVDGVERKSEDSGLSAISATGENLSIGKGEDPAQHVQDELMIFNETLSQEEISDLYDYRGYTTPNSPNTTMVKKYTDSEPIVEIGDRISADLEINCVDVDNFSVPNAEVIISGEDDFHQSGVTDEDGKFMATDLSEGLYNITVNYTQHGLIDGETEIVYFEEDYNLTGLEEDPVKELDLDLWTLHFNISDYDDEPIDNGYILLQNDSETVGNQTLDNGMATIRWLNQSEYDYEVYYDYTMLTDDSLYNQSQLLIFNDTVSRNSTDIEKQTLFSSVSFEVRDDSNDPLQNALVKIYNETYSPKEQDRVAELKTDGEGTATFYGLNNQTAEWGNYTVLIEFAGSNRTFREKGNDEWLEKDQGLNMTFDDQLSLSLEVQLNIEDYETKLEKIDQEPSNFFEDIEWGDNVSIKVNFSSIVNETDSELVDPDTIQLQFRDSQYINIGDPIDLMEHKVEGETGIFNFTFNTTEQGLSSGEDSESYSMRITASKTGYTDPDPLNIGFEVQALPTEVELHDYDDIYYDESENITVSYRNTNDNSSISGAELSYSLGDWDSADYIDDAEDPENPGNYTFLVNASLPDDVGSYTMEIIMRKENHTTEEITDTVYIVRRPTSINNHTDVLSVSETIDVGEAVNFTFTYRDIRDDNSTIEDLTVAEWEWGNEEEGNLIPLSNGSLLLDFNTENRDTGEYNIYVYLEKDNYESRMAIVNLRVNIRDINWTLSEEFDNRERLKMDCGDPVSFSIQLNDSSDLSAIEDANVTLQLEDTDFFNELSYSLEENEGGNYSLHITDYQPLDPELIYDIFSAELNITKANYTTTIIPLTLRVENREFYYDQLFLNNVNSTDDRAIALPWNDSLPIGVVINDSQTDEFVSNLNLTLSNEDISVSLEERDGTYNGTIEAGKLPVDTHTFTLEGIKDNYTVSSIRISVTVTNRETEISDPFIDGEKRSSYEVAWNESISVAIGYNDTDLESYIEDANVIITGSGINGTLELEGIYYNATIAPGALDVGTHMLTITAQKTNYSTQIDTITITITNREFAYNLTYSTGDQEMEIEDQEVEIYEGEDLHLNISLNDNLTSMSLDNATIKYDSGANFTDNGDGTYNMTISAEDLPKLDDFQTITSDNVELTIEKENYITETSYITVIIRRREFDYKMHGEDFGEDGEENLYSIYSGENIKLTFTLTDKENESLEGANVSMTFQDTDFNFTYEGDGNYTLTLKAGDNYTRLEEYLESQTFMADIKMEKAQYLTQQHQIAIKITNIQFNYNFSFPEEGSEGYEVSIYDGDPLAFNITLTNEIEDNEPPVEGADINMTYQGSNYKFEHLENGTYKINITDYDKFEESSRTDLAKISISKLNFETINISLTVIIEKRTFDFTDNQGIYEDTKTLTVEHGEEITLRFNLSDSSTDGLDMALTNATLTLRIAGENGENGENGETYVLEETEPGIYTLTLETEQYETLLQGKTFSCTLEIEKENYETQEINFNVYVGMEKVGPIPIFYLILGIIFGVGLIGSLGTYRYIRLARIPEFVKRADKMKEAIESNKKIPESLIYPSKKEFAAKKLGDKWREYGLSLGAILGVEETKIKKKPIDKDQGGGSK